MNIDVFLFATVFREGPEKAFLFPCFLFVIFCIMSFCLFFLSFFPSFWEKPGGPQATKAPSSLEGLGVLTNHKVSKDREEAVNGAFGCENEPKKERPAHRHTDTHVSLRFDQPPILECWSRLWCPMIHVLSCPASGLLASFTSEGGVLWARLTACFCHGGS